MILRMSEFFSQTNVFDFSDNLLHLSRNEMVTPQIYERMAQTVDGSYMVRIIWMA